MNNIDNLEILKLNGINIIDNFLTRSECHNLLEESRSSLFWTGTKVISQLSTVSFYEDLSSSRDAQVLHECNFGRNLKAKVDRVNNLLRDTIDIDLEKLENWQITKYESGGFYDFHNDCGCWKNDPSGEREKTILIYLLSPCEGGETYFRALNHYVRPMQGRLVFWDNLLKNGNCNYGMIHASLTVKQGMKMTFNTWLRQNNFIKL
jgi:prolyl 4-hydroxylase